MAITSPVDRISGPRRGSSPRPPGRGTDSTAARTPSPRPVRAAACSHRPAVWEGCLRFGVRRCSHRRRYGPRPSDPLQPVIGLLVWCSLRFVRGWRFFGSSRSMIERGWNRSGAAMGVMKGSTAASERRWLDWAGNTASVISLPSRPVAAKPQAGAVASITAPAGGASSATPTTIIEPCRPIASPRTLAGTSRLNASAVSATVGAVSASGVSGAAGAGGSAGVSGACAAGAQRVRCPRPNSAQCCRESVATTPLLGRFRLSATWTNVREHAAGPPDYWGSRGRRFESGRPDRQKALTSGNAGQGFKFVYGVLNRPPKTPHLLGSATRFVIHAHRWVGRVRGLPPPVVGAQSLEDV
jgi:hypothetical protein